MHVRKFSFLLLAAALAYTGAACKPGQAGGSGTGSAGSASNQSASSAVSETASADSAEESGVGSMVSQTGTNTSKASSATAASKVAPQTLTKKSFDFAVKALPGSKSRELLNNPDRGFRLETYIDVSNGGWLAGGNGTPTAIESTGVNIRKYAPENPRLAQVYFYLNKYCDRDLDQKAFNHMQAYMDYLAGEGIGILARFCYQYDENNNTIGATKEQILRHINQLKPFLEKNKNKIFVIQAAFLGLWGEWHNFVNITAEDRKPLLEAIIDAVPKEKFVQVRMVDYKNLLDLNDPRRARVGFEDFYLVGVDHRWHSCSFPGTPQYAQQTREAPTVMTDGELPWGSDRGEIKGDIDGYLIAKRLSLHCFSSLSIVHGYTEGNGSYSMVRWQETATGKAKLDSENLAYEPGWFNDENGSTVQRSVFAYIRDHLGYYLVASGAKANISGGKLNVSLNLTNYGFATPLTMNQPELVLLDAGGKIVSTQALCKTSALKTKAAVSVSAQFSVPANPYGYAVGVRFANPAGACAKLANDVPFQNGVNILGALKN